MDIDVVLGNPNDRQKLSGLTLSQHLVVTTSALIQIT